MENDYDYKTVFFCSIGTYVKRVQKGEGGHLRGLNYADKRPFWQLLPRENRHKEDQREEEEERREEEHQRRAMEEERAYNEAIREVREEMEAYRETLDSKPLPSFTPADASDKPPKSISVQIPITSKNTIPESDTNQTKPNISAKKKPRVTRGQILSAIPERGEIRQGTLCKTLEVDSSNIVPIVKRLEKNGLIVVRRGGKKTFIHRVTQGDNVAPVKQ